MQKIIPHLWFDHEALDAAKFYSKVFPNYRVDYITQIHDTPSGDADIVAFSIMGFKFMAISAGPFFKIDPSISFHVKCATAQEVDEIWKKLLPGGTVRMELGTYPFSKRYGWIQDKFGVSWQIIQSDGDLKQRITPVMMFSDQVAGKSEEAGKFYASVFRHSKLNVLARYDKGEEPDKPGTVKYAQLVLEGQEFGAMDSARVHGLRFSEAISLIVNCQNQKEIDYYWEALSAVPAAEQCGWLKDKYGVSWQIIPENMKELTDRNPKKTMPVMLKMKKIVIEDLEEAGE